MIPGAEPNSLRRSGVEKVQDGPFQRPVRPRAGELPVAGAEALEAFATEGARKAEGGTTAHVYFHLTGGGIAFAENVCRGWMGWNVQGSVQVTIADSLAASCSEDPVAGHAATTTVPSEAVAFGWAVVNHQALSIVQDFGR